MTDLVWRKSSRSGSETKCVEVAQAADGIAVRDSKDPEGGQLRVGPSEWGSFLSGLKGGRFRSAK
ncbi:DUF397 domain-containing protein [Saccharopolyspora dendranthemae]|uniref:Uncharacterized protein DUF397 n=1 Tax=Saccharopolyspora dendranthemae TaxID=1181886 RepID=A0A561U1P8_9PSEU|nr:DUF397 domain-containing protein [Saccharopolyspora dendranthemae]TWF93297.1 uncharacterized protein DUF397 [Saccharopolyspora dendranthemae]